MIRDFDWRDLAMLHRVRNRGLYMDSKLAYTGKSYSVQSALRDAFTFHRDACTLVLRPDVGNGEGVLGQFQIHPEHGYARLTFISPQEAIPYQNGIELIEALVHSAGQHGAQSVLAEIDENHNAIEGLRKAGFAIFARQRIWRLESPSETIAPTDAHPWRAETSEDKSTVAHLYTNLIPALVQQVEPLGLGEASGVVYFADDELLGYLHLSQGERGDWIRPYFHPAAAITGALLGSGLRLLLTSEDKPLFVCVRSYQGGIEGALEKLGFVWCANEAVMVKRLAKPVTQEEQQMIPVLNGKSPEPTAPFTPINGATPVLQTKRES